MNFLNGENVDAALAALSFIPGKGVIFKGVRMLAAAAFTIDDVMEAFGGNLTGADPKELARVKRDAQSMIDANQPAQADTSSNVQPTDNLMGGSSTDSSKEDGVEANTSQANFQSEDSTQPADVSPSGSQEPPAAQISSSSSSSTSSSQVGPTPKPEPQVNIIPQSSNPQSVPAEGGAQASKIPNIPSSNIDNFYTLYSQVNYNVVT
jgi:cobalamin biosynthesis Mg chelatase CobN